MSEDPKHVPAERLRQLSEEVSRLAATLERLVAASGKEQGGAESSKDSGRTEVPLELVSSVIRARQRRRHHFPRELFADPAWDMMLHLLEAEILERRVEVSSLGAAAAVPPEIARRWVTALLDHGVIVRRPHPIHLGRIFVELSPAASTALRDCLNELQARGTGSP